MLDDLKKASKVITGSRNPAVDKQAEIIAKQSAEIEELKKLKPKNSDDIAPGIRRTDTFHGAYRNGYENGEVAKAVKAAKEKQKVEEGMQIQS